MKKIMAGLFCLTAFSCASNQIQETRKPAQAGKSPGSLIEISCADMKTETRSNIKFLVAKLSKEYFFEDDRNIGLDAMKAEGRAQLKNEIEKLTAAQIVGSEVKLKVNLDNGDSAFYNVALKDKVDQIKTSNVAYNSDHGGSYDRYWMQMDLNYGVKNKMFNGKCDLVSITDENYNSYSERLGPSDR